MKTSYKLDYGSFLQYSPRGKSNISKQSRVFRDYLKFDKKGFISFVISKFIENPTVKNLGLLNFFKGAILVPIPRSGIIKKGMLWPAKRISEELIKFGLGQGIEEIIQRKYGLPKSAFANPGERPTLNDHLNSFYEYEKIVLIDDIITKGTTILASTIKIKDVFKNADVKGFTIIRTMGLIPEIDKIVKPCIGKIFLDKNNKVQREP